MCLSSLFNVHKNNYSLFLHKLYRLRDASYNYRSPIFYTSPLTCKQLSLISAIDREVMCLYIAANAPHAFIPVIYQHPFPLFSPIFGRWQAVLKIVCTLRAGTIARGEAVVAKSTEQWPLYKRHPRSINHSYAVGRLFIRGRAGNIRFSRVNMQKNCVKSDVFFVQDKENQMSNLTYS